MIELGYDRKPETRKHKYDVATEQKYNFLMIDLLASDADHMLHCGLDKRFVPSELMEEAPSNISPQSSGGIT